MQDGDVTAQIWGITYSQIWAKKGGYAEFEKFSKFSILRGIVNLPPSQISLAAS